MVGTVERLKVPILLKAAKPPEVVPLKLPGRNEMPDGGVTEVVPVSVISSARALPADKANTATSKTTAMIPVRFTCVLPLEYTHFAYAALMVVIASQRPALSQC